MMDLAGYIRKSFSILSSVNDPSLDTQALKVTDLGIYTLLGPHVAVYQMFVMTERSTDIYIMKCQFGACLSF